MSKVLTLISNPREKALTTSLVTDLQKACKLEAPVKWLNEGIACDIPLGDAGAALGDALSSALGGTPLDYAVLDIKNRKKKFLIADMDSTMIEQECIDELAAELGIKEEIAAITAKAMRGELVFEDALRSRVGLLKGLPESVIGKVLETRISYMPGGKTLVATMKANGAYCALVSGGFTPFTAAVAEALGFDENRANTLHITDGKLSGTVGEPILGQEAKLQALEEISARLGITVSDAIAVGDGANDLAMIRCAGLGVALHAKPAVAAEADVKIDYGDLTALLYLQGYAAADFVN